MLAEHECTNTIGTIQTDHPDWLLLPFEVRATKRVRFEVQKFVDIESHQVQ
jgi:hypothetical protein